MRGYGASWWLGRWFDGRRADALCYHLVLLRLWMLWTLLGCRLALSGTRGARSHQHVGEVLGPEGRVDRLLVPRRVPGGGAGVLDQVCTGPAELADLRKEVAGYSLRRARDRLASARVRMLLLSFSKNI